MKYALFLRVVTFLSYRAYLSTFISHCFDIYNNLNTYYKPNCATKRIREQSDNTNNSNSKIVW